MVFQIPKLPHSDQAINSNQKDRSICKMEEKPAEDKNLQVIKKDNNYLIN